MAWILRGEQLTPVSECLEDVHEFPETTLAELQASYRRCAPDESCGGGAVVPNERPGPSGSDESGNPIRSAVIGASAFAVARRRGAGSDRGSPIGWPCCTEDADAGRCRWLNCQGLGFLPPARARTAAPKGAILPPGHRPLAHGRGRCGRFPFDGGGPRCHRSAALRSRFRGEWRVGLDHERGSSGRSGAGGRLGIAILALVAAGVTGCGRPPPAGLVAGSTAPAAAWASDYPPPAPVATATMTPVPGAFLALPEGIEVVNTTIDDSPHREMILPIRQYLESGDWELLASHFAPSWTAPRLLPIVAMSYLGSPAFVEYDHLAQFFRNLETLGSSPRIQGYMQKDGQVVGCIWVLVSGWAGPVAMDTVAPWNPVYPTSTPTPSSTRVPSHLAGSTPWLDEIPAGTYAWELCPVVDATVAVFNWTIGEYRYLVSSFYRKANYLAPETELPILPYYRIVD